MEKNIWIEVELYIDASLSLKPYGCPDITELHFLFDFAVS